jgi:adenylate kinase family enzyme
VAVNFITKIGISQAMWPVPTIPFVGAAGSGKGTQISMLKTVFPGSFYDISTGELLLKLPQDHPYHVKRARGELFDDKDMLDTLVAEIERAARDGEYDPARQILITDGYSRTASQVGMGQPYFNVRDVAFFDNVDEATSIARILKRAELDAAAGKTPRPEDNEAAARVRYQSFITKTLAVIPAYEQVGAHIIRLDAAQPKEVVAGTLVRQLMEPRYRF